MDIGSCLFATWFSLYLRLDEFFSLNSTILVATTISVALIIPTFLVFGVYSLVLRFFDWMSVLSITRSFTVYGFAYFLVLSVISVEGVPRTIGILQPIILFVCIVSTRGIFRLGLGGNFPNKNQTSLARRVLIYGAGKGGHQVVNLLRSSPEFNVVGFVDDNPELHGCLLLGLRVFSPGELLVLIGQKNVTLLIIAIPSLSISKRIALVNELADLSVAVRRLPSIARMASGQLSLADIQDLDVRDILGRNSVESDVGFLEETLSGKCILITGAGGSIGSELSSQIVDLSPGNLILMDISESSLYEVSEMINEKIRISKDPQGNFDLTVVLGSVSDETRVQEILTTFKPNVVFHAAAYKHVPIVEQRINSLEAFKTNVLGTAVMAKQASENGVERFVLVSSDKAVRPTNIMGATKRLAEVCVQAKAASNGHQTLFSMVRFGNVLNSSGSVIPKFRTQIQFGGPVTVTDKDVTRFFMTIPEAAELVIQSSAIALGGDLFVLDMGQPIKIAELAKRLIRLSGFTVRDESNLSGDIGIEYIGLRPGEKLHEELFLAENPESTTHPKIFKAREPLPNDIEFDAIFSKLIEIVDKRRLDTVLALLVEYGNYSPNYKT